MVVDLDGAAPEEISKAVRRFEKQDAGIVKAEGDSASARARAISSKWLPVLTEGLVRVLTVPNDEPSLRTFLALVQRLDRATLALCLLQGALEDVGRIENNYTKTALGIGGNIHIECFAAGLFKGYPKGAAGKIRKHFAGKPKRGRRKVAFQLYKTRDWSPEALLIAGNWGIDRLFEFLPGVFDIEERLPSLYLESVNPNFQPESKEKTREIADSGVNQTVHETFWFSSQRASRELNGTNRWRASISPATDGCPLFVRPADLRLRKLSSEGWGLS